MTNNGPSAVTGAAVTDNFPAALTNVTWTCSATGGSSCGGGSGSGNINTTVNLAVGGAATFVAVGTINSSATGTLANTAAVAAPAGVTDPTPGNNSATDTDTLTPQADLAVTKTDGQTSAVPGTSDTYTITVTNNGPSAVTGAAVTDNFPAAFTGVTWSCSATGGSSCGGGSGSGNLNTTVNLAVGGAATFVATGTVDSSATGALVNMATVAAPAGVTDPTPGNNSATDTTTITSAPALSIAKTDAPDPVAAGGVLTYTLTVQNTGAANATGVTITDSVPAHTTFRWADSGGAQVGSQVRWTGQTVNAGGSLTVRFSVNVGTVVSGTVITNAAYGVTCAEGVGAAGSAVTTLVKVEGYKLYLPLVLRNF